MNQQFELFEIANPCIGLCQSNMVACVVELSASYGMI